MTIPEDIEKIDEQLVKEDRVYEALKTLWLVWLEQEDIPKISADDLMHSHYMDDEDTYTEKQRRFTETYCRLWSLEND